MSVSVPGAGAERGAATASTDRTSAGSGGGVPEVSAAGSFHAGARSVDFVPGALVIGVLASAQRGEVAAQATPAAGAIEAVARQAIAAANDAMAGGEMSALDAVFAPDVEGHPPHRSLVTGEPFSHDLAGLKAGLADIRLVFSEVSIVIDDLIVNGETVAARVTFRGAPDAAAFGLDEATSQQLEIGGLIFGEIEGGRVAEFWAYFDLSAYFDLIGLAPSGMTTTAKAEVEHGHDTDTEIESPHPDAEQVAVTLTEFSVTPAMSTLRVGQPYSFVVTNEGAVPHEFVIERAGAVHEPLVGEEREAMTGLIAPGTSGSLSWTFAEPGAYQLACHQPGHYEAGQVYVIDVAG